MCGGYSVLKDIYKMTVFALCRWRNASHPLDALGPKGAVMVLVPLIKNCVTVSSNSSRIMSSSVRGIFQSNCRISAVL